MKIDTNQIQDLLEKLSTIQLNSAKPLQNSDPDVSLQVDYASFIKEATKTQQTDTKDIQRAQQLLSSGKLETPQNIRAAAENITKFGI